MQTKFEKFIGSKWVMLISTLFFLVACVALDLFMGAHYEVREGLYYIAGDLFEFIVLVIAVVSYIKHEKNVMKAILGVILVSMVFNNITYFAEWIVYEPSDIITLFSGITAALTVCFFINHIVLALNHTSKPKVVNVNFIIGLLMILSHVVLEIIFVIDGTNIGYGIAYMFYVIPSIVVVLSIETNIDYFKKLREEKEEDENEEQTN